MAAAAISTAPRKIAIFQVSLLSLTGGRTVPTKRLFKANAPFMSSFSWGRLLEHSFLEHFCLDQFSVIQGKFYMQDSRTPRLVEYFWVPILEASCSNKLFVGTLRPSHLRWKIASERRFSLQFFYGKDQRTTNPL